MPINTDEVSILVNVLGGLDQFVEVTGIDKIDTLRILTGYKFNRKEQSQIEIDLGRIYQNQLLNIDFDIDILPFVERMESIRFTAENNDLVSEIQLGLATEQISLVDLADDVIWRFLMTRSPYGKRLFADALDDGLFFDEIKDKVSRKDKTKYLENQINDWQDEVEIGGIHEYRTPDDELVSTGETTTAGEFIETFTKWALLGESIGGLQNIRESHGMDAETASDFWDWWKQWFGNESP